MRAGRSARKPRDRPVTPRGVGAIGYGFLALMVGLVVWLGVDQVGADQGGDSCDSCPEATVTIIPTQDGVPLGAGDSWVWEPYAQPLEYYVVLSVPAGCCDIPPGGDLLFIAPDGVLTVMPVSLPIAHDEPVQRGPFGYIPTSDECPGVQATVIYRPLDGNVHTATSSINRLAVDPCSCDGDVNDDGVVDVDDLTGVILNWGVVCPTWP